MLKLSKKLTSARCVLPGIFKRELPSSARCVLSAHFSTSVPGIYKRELPSPPAIDLTSHDGKNLLMESLQNGTAQGFLHLISHHQTQAHLSFCGLTSASIVLNALRIDPKAPWRGSYRWFDEWMFKDAISMTKVERHGITLQEATSICRWAGAKVETIHSSETSMEDFRTQVFECSSSGEHHMIAAYDRKPLLQFGDGHFSPVGCYHHDSDMLLILDVARFKYPPHWLPLADFWRAMDTIDTETGLKRGFMLVSRPSSLGTLHMFVTRRHVGLEFSLCLKL